VSPEELRASLRKEEETPDQRFACFLDLMCGQDDNPEAGGIVPDPKIDKWEDARVKMTDEEWAEYLADTLSLAMNQCPRCYAPVTNHPIGGSKIVRTYNCTRFNEHSFIRAAPLDTDAHEIPPS
jgi:hypothetical protein